MPCEKFDDLLTGYSELSALDRAPVDAHLRACSACREYFETLAALDRSLTTLYSGLEPRRVFNAAAVRQPSALPELLDFCGWAAIVAIIALLSVAVAGRFGIVLKLPANSGWFGSGVIATIAGAALRGRFRRTPSRA